MRHSLKHSPRRVAMKQRQDGSTIVSDMPAIASFGISMSDGAFVVIDPGGWQQQGDRQHKKKRGRAKLLAPENPQVKTCRVGEP